MKLPSFFFIKVFSSCSKQVLAYCTNKTSQLYTIHNNVGKHFLNNNSTVAFSFAMRLTLRKIALNER